jgi:hypothetical protein
MAVKKVDASSKKEEADNRPSYKTLEELCAKYSKLSTTPEIGGNKVFRVNTQMTILREFCSLHNYTYKIIPKFIDVAPSVRTVAVTVQIIDSFKEVLWETFGVSSRYTYTLSSKIKDAAMEVAQTVATGKALAMIGISPEEFVACSAEELELFSSIQQKVDPQILRAKASELIAKLPEEYKKRARYANLSLDDMMDLIDVEKDDINILIERLGKHLETTKGGTLDNVKASVVQTD